MKTNIRQVLPVAAELFLKQSFWKQKYITYSNKKNLITGGSQVHLRSLLIPWAQYLPTLALLSHFFIITRKLQPLIFLSQSLLFWLVLQRQCWNLIRFLWLPRKPKAASWEIEITKFLFCLKNCPLFKYKSWLVLTFITIEQKPHFLNVNGKPYTFQFNLTESSCKR